MKPNHALIACLEVAVLLANQNPDATPYRIARAVHDLHKIGQQLHRRYEASCSYAHANTEAYEKRTATLEDRATEAAANARITLGFQRDPRGWPLVISVNGREYQIGGAA
jgi:hypothetical protein